MRRNSSGQNLNAARPHSITESRPAVKQALQDAIDARGYDTLSDVQTAVTAP